MHSWAEFWISCSDEENIDLGDRVIKKEDLQKHMELVKSLSSGFQTPVAWERCDNGFKRKGLKKDK